MKHNVNVSCYSKCLVIFSFLKKLFENGKIVKDSTSLPHLSIRISYTYNKNNINTNYPSR